MLSWFRKPHEENIRKAKDNAYYDALLKKYGRCRKLQGHASLLVIADTHGRLKEDEIREASYENYDACFLLGDHSIEDVFLVKQYILACPVYGILGNHDDNDLYDFTNVKNIAGKAVTISGIRFSGMQGCPIYKENMIGLTQEESIAAAAALPEADVLVSHCSAFVPELESEKIHAGYKGISEYLYRNHVPVHIFGHNHESKETVLSNGCREICVYGIQKIIL